MQQRLKDFYIPEIISIKHEGGYVEAPKPVEWYPLQLAWYMTVPKSVIRRFAPFASFQKFLVAENDVGNISRQEVVSMIPPLLMHIEPGMTVLDLCAAPGSKSAQLLEMVLGGEEERTAAVATAASRGEPIPDYEDDGRSTGLLIANDVDYRRAHMLTHQLKRLSSANLIVTNHDATMFPSIKLPSEPNAEGKAVPNKYLKFDRILADVPCSGDGTARKNLEIWRTWTPQNALGLHITQIRILVRALQMLKVGGRVIYSTCSMNPVEDEAVLVAAIDRCGGSDKVELVDCSNELPGLKRYPGKPTWNVMDRNGGVWHKYADVEASRKIKDDVATNKLAETMFPPIDPELTGLPLQHAMRVYPHSQDTGAFFIAVLEKKSEIKARPENESRKPTKTAAAQESIDQGKPETSERDGSHILTATPLEPATLNGDSAAPEQNENGPNLKRKAETEEEVESKKARVAQTSSNGLASSAASQMAHPLPNKPPLVKPDIATTELRSEPVEEAELQHPLPGRPLVPGKRKKDQPFEEPFKYLSPDIAELQQIRQFYSISERFPMDRFMVRNAAGTATKNIYYTTALAKGILTENEGKGLKFVHSGVKMFVKQDVPNPEICPWRIQTDGLTVLERWVGEQRIIRLQKKETLRKLLVEMFPKFSGDSWKDLGEIGSQVLDIKHGCCVLRVEPGEGEDDLKEYMVFPLWKSLHSLNLMLPKEDRRAMLLRLFNDTTPLVNPMKGGTPKSGANGTDARSGKEGPTEDGGFLLDVVEQELDKTPEPKDDDAADGEDGNTSSEGEGSMPV